MANAKIRELALMGYANAELDLLEITANTKVYFSNYNYLIDEA